MLEADRLPITVAPAIAAKLEGGTGTQRSSQISKNNRRLLILAAWKIRFGPNGMSFCPARDIVDVKACDAGENCRPS